jgi:hypothetical protein
MNQNYALFAGLMLIFFVSACTKPFDAVDLNVNLTPEYAVPLVETDMNVQDLFDGFNGNAFLQIQSNGSFVMSSQSQTIETPLINVLSQIPTIISVPILDKNMIRAFPKPDSMRIDAVDFKSGFFKWRFAAQSTPLTVTLTVPQITKNGVTLTKTFTLSNQAVRDSIDLKDWTCVPTQGVILISYDATTNMGESISLVNQGSYEFTNLGYKNIKGYFGSLLMSFPKDSIALDFFKNWRPNGKISFSEPRITYNITNPFGFPIRLRSSVIEGINQAGQKTGLSSPLSGGEDIAFPSMSEMGQSKTTTKVIDDKNSNIVQVLEKHPTAIYYSCLGIANLGSNPNSTSFITEDSRLKMSLKMDIPLIGSAEKFAVLDTMVLDLSKFSEVSKAEFKLTTNNDLPLDMALQGYFVDASGVIIDSLVQNQPLILRGAATTTFGTTIGSSLAYNFIKIDEKKFAAIRTAKKIIVKYTVSSTNNGANPVKINASQNFNLKLGVRATIKN